MLHAEPMCWNRQLMLSTDDWWATVYSNQTSTEWSKKWYPCFLNNPVDATASCWAEQRSVRHCLQQWLGRECGASVNHLWRNSRAYSPYSYFRLTTLMTRAHIDARPATRYVTAIDVWRHDKLGVGQTGVDQGSRCSSPTEDRNSADLCAAGGTDRVWLDILETVNRNTLRAINL